MRREKWASLHNFRHPLASGVWSDWSLHLLESHESVSPMGSGNKSARLRVCPPDASQGPSPWLREWSEFGASGKRQGKVLNTALC